MECFRNIVVVSSVCAVVGGLLDSISCTFDSGHLCGFQQDQQDDRDWQLNSGYTATFHTGPDCDPRNCSTGTYLYFETSIPTNVGDRARLRTPALTGSGPQCLSFYQHMYGSNMGSLAVSMATLTSGSVTSLWEAHGNQGNQWHYVQVDLQATEAYEIWFDGTKGSAYRSDMALDSISVLPGRCAAHGQFDCTFSHDLCGWTNASSPTDTKDWSRHSGDTPTPGTGPQADRMGQYDGYYLYVESSRSFPGDFARLVSPSVASSPEGSCLTVWYHMHGADTGNITVSVLTDVGQLLDLWSVAGDQGDAWHKRSHSIQVTATGGGNTGAPSKRFHVLIDASLAGGSYGDVAIDDVSMTSGLCGS